MHFNHSNDVTTFVHSKDFWKSSKPCHVGIHWIALTKCSRMSTHLAGFQSFFSIFVLAKLATSSIRVKGYVPSHWFKNVRLHRVDITFFADPTLGTHTLFTSGFLNSFMCTVNLQKCCYYTILILFKIASQHIFTQKVKGNCWLRWIMNHSSLNIFLKRL